jgi:glutamine synthetase
LFKAEVSLANNPVFNRARAPIHAHLEVPYSPRAVLKSQVVRLDTMGLMACMATTLEYFLFKGIYEEAQQDGYRDLRTFSPYNKHYHIFLVTKEEDTNRAIRNTVPVASLLLHRPLTRLRALQTSPVVSNRTR